MSPMAISVFSFFCIFIGALLGLYLRSVLPKHHLSDKTMEAVKVGIALIATLTALVLGLLVSSAKDSLDKMTAEITESGARVILVDRILARYGPDTDKARAELRHCLASALEILCPEGEVSKSGVNVLVQRAGIEEVHDMLRRLSPQDEYQRLIITQALGIMDEMAKSRWLIIERMQSTLPMPLLVFLVLWLTVFFICFGLLSERNATVIAVMFICALSVAGAIFLILEMSNPLQGFIKVSYAPLRNALAQIGQ